MARRIIICICILLLLTGCAQSASSTVSESIENDSTAYVQNSQTSMGEQNNITIQDNRSATNSNEYETVSPTGTENSELEAARQNDSATVNNQVQSGNGNIVIQDNRSQSGDKTEKDNRTDSTTEPADTAETENPVKTDNQTKNSETDISMMSYDARMKHTISELVDTLNENYPTSGGTVKSYENQYGCYLKVDVQYTAETGMFADLVSGTTDDVLAVCNKYNVLCMNVDITLVSPESSVFKTATLLWNSTLEVDASDNSHLSTGSVCDRRNGWIYVRDVSAYDVDAAFQTPEYLAEYAESQVEWKSGGTYEIGKDLPAGEYVLKHTGSGTFAYMCVSSDTTGDISSILCNENFNGYYFISVSDGQYLKIERAKFTDVDDFVTTFDASNLEAGMYRVGIDIPAGQYYCTKTEESRLFGYYCVYSNDTPSFPIVSNDNFENTAYVTVSDGQYLYLSGCDAAIQ